MMEKIILKLFLTWTCKMIHRHNWKKHNYCSWMLQYDRNFLSSIERCLKGGNKGYPVGQVLYHQNILYQAGLKLEEHTDLTIKWNKCIEIWSATDFQIFLHQILLLKCKYSHPDFKDSLGSDRDLIHQNPQHVNFQSLWNRMVCFWTKTQLHISHLGTFTKT